MGQQIEAALFHTEKISLDERSSVFLNCRRSHVELGDLATQPAALLEINYTVHEYVVDSRRA